MIALILISKTIERKIFACLTSFSLKEICIIKRNVRPIGNKVLQEHIVFWLFHYIWALVNDGFCNPSQFIVKISIKKERYGRAAIGLLSGLVDENFYYTTLSLMFMPLGRQ